MRTLKNLISHQHILKRVIYSLKAENKLEFEIFKGALTKWTHFYKTKWANGISRLCTPVSHNIKII